MAPGRNVEAEAFGEVVKALAGLHGLRQDELAERIGISKQAANALMRGRARPSLWTAKNIARLFGVSLEALTTGKPVNVLREAVEQYETLHPVIVDVDAAKRLIDSEVAHPKVVSLNHAREGR